MTRLQEINQRQANWQKRIEADLAPYYEQADGIGKIKIDNVIGIILHQIGVLGKC